MDEDFPPPTDGLADAFVTDQMDENVEGLTACVCGGVLGTHAGGSGVLTECPWLRQRYLEKHGAEKVVAWRAESLRLRAEEGVS